jgi:predicted transcriptional regulator
MRHVDKKGFKTIARELRLSKNTVKKVIREDKTAHHYRRSVQPYRVLEGYINELVLRLEFDKTEPKRRRRTARKLYLEIYDKGYKGSYESVNNFVKKWRLENNGYANTVYVPLEFDPGEAFQFDWSEEEIELAGKLVRIKVAHIRLSHSRLFLTSSDDTDGFLLYYKQKQLS